MVFWFIKGAVMVKIKYALAISPEPRCLVSISFYVISFNLSSYMTFDTPEQADDFKKRWNDHFFNLEKLAVVKVEEK